MSNSKPLGRKAYGSIGHIHGSRLGPGDHTIAEGQTRICTGKTRDRHDRVIVQEKLDGACVAVAHIEGGIVALGRAGYLAESSPYSHIRAFGEWVGQNRIMLSDILTDGERLVGEWLAKAHSTRYDLTGKTAWMPFDLFRSDNTRACYDEFLEVVEPTGMSLPHVLHNDRCAMPIAAAWLQHSMLKHCEGEPEGVVYRVERKGKVDFLAKWVRPDKVDGDLMDDDVWNKNWEMFK